MIINDGNILRTCREQEMLQGFKILMTATAFQDVATIVAAKLVGPKMEVLLQLQAAAGGRRF